MASPIARLSSDILLIILEDVPRHTYWNGDLLPLMAVCKAWKDTVEQIFYRIVILHHHRRISKLVDTLESTENRTQRLGSSIQHLTLGRAVVSDRTQKVRMNMLKLLTLVDNLRGIDCPEGLAPTMLATLCHTCAHSLVTLHAGYDGSPTGMASEMTHIGRLQNLRSLDLRTNKIHGRLPGREEIDFTNMSPWMLPQLESLSWTQVDRFDQYDNTHAILFIARCHFPRLRKARLLIPSSGDATASMVQFLRQHPNIESLDLAVDESQYSAVLPHVKATALDLSSCDIITPALVNHLSLSIRDLYIPVYLNSIQRPLDAIYGVLERLTKARTSVKNVHMYSRPTPDNRVIERGLTSLDKPLLFGATQANLHAIRAEFMGRLWYYALKLAEIKKIRLYDEDEMRFDSYMSAVRLGDDDED